MNGLLVVFQEIFGDGEGFVLFFEDWGDADGEVGSDGEQACFEGFVVKGIDGEAFLGIETVFSGKASAEKK